MDKSLAYNLRQGFTPGEIKKIEIVTGRRKPKGIFDLALVKQVRKWQSKNGIPVDGKIWKSALGNTWPLILNAYAVIDAQAKTSAHQLKTGIWIDDAASRVLTDEYMDSLKALDISEAALMINKSNTRARDPDWSLRWPREKFVQAAHLLEDRGIDVVLTVWPKPKKTQIDRLCEDLKDLVTATKAIGVDFDAEGNWKKKYLSGFKNMNQAAEYLCKKVRAMATDIRLGMNTYPSHGELGNAPALSLLVDVITPQAYSLFKNNAPAYQWNNRLGPGNMQEFALSKARNVAAKNTLHPEVCCGLAAWRQELFPGHTPEEAMQRALDRALSSDIERLRFWSSKWIVGVRENDYAAKFIKKISGKSSA